MNVSATLRKRADAIDKQLGQIALDYDCNITPRRAEQLKNNQKRYDNLKNMQVRLRTLARMHEDGTLPRDLFQIRSAADIDLIMYCTYPKPARLNSDVDWVRADAKKTQKRMNRLHIYCDMDLEQVRALIYDMKFELSEEEKNRRRIKELEDQLIGCKIPGFFPTPDTLVDRLVEGIPDDAVVLEPSAGFGSIAD